MSQLPGFGDPPNPQDMFTTTSGSTHTLLASAAASSAAGTPRHHAEYKTKGERHAPDIFGVSRQRKAAPPAETTSQSMNSNCKGWALQPTPRFVNGGAFRNSSTVALGKNLVPADGSYQKQDFATTQGTMLWGGGPIAQRPMHRFELPQKNTSTYLTTSLRPTDEIEPERIREHGSVGRVNARPERSMGRASTSHGVPPSQLSYGKPPMGGITHFLTTNAQHYVEHPGTRLVVPPGKGGVDRSLSMVPLGSDFDASTPMPQPHSQTVFTGQQLDELRHTCASRGTLGARGGRKLPRGSSGAPAGFSRSQRVDDLWPTVK